MDPLPWLFVTMALTLIFIVFAVNPLQVAIDEAITNNARLEARRIASAINIVSTAPDGTAYMLNLPRTKCNIRITGDVISVKINVGGKDISETIGLLKTVPVVADEEFDCKTMKKIKLLKNDGTLRITRG